MIIVIILLFIGGFWILSASTGSPSNPPKTNYRPKQNSQINTAKTSKLENIIEEVMETYLLNSFRGELKENISLEYLLAVLESIRNSLLRKSWEFSKDYNTSNDKVIDIINRNYKTLLIKYSN